MGAKVRTSDHRGPTVRVCPQCGARLHHLQGATGRISLCCRCGWSRAESKEQGRGEANEEKQSHGP